jgi:acetyltransferase-like isoleucine patch superfamily enzyme
MGVRTSSSNSLLSLLVPHHGRRIDDVSKLLEGLTIADQENLSIEIIVCVDKDIEIVGPFDQRIRIVCTDIENSPPGYKRNVLAREAEGRYLWFLDADDVLLSDTLPRLLNILEKSNADVIFTNFMSEDVEGNILDVSRVPAGIDKVKEIRFFSLCEAQKSQNILYIDKVMPWSNAVYRQIVSREYLLSNSISFSNNVIGEDHEFSLDLLALNPTVRFHSSVTYRHILHSNSISRNLSKFLLTELLTSLRRIKVKISQVPDNAFREGLLSYYSEIYHIAPYATLGTFSKKAVSILGREQSLKLYYFKISGKIKYELKSMMAPFRLPYLSRIVARFRRVLKRFWRTGESGFNPPISGFHPLGSFEASKRITSGSNVHCDSNISFETGLGYLSIGSNTSIGSGTIIITQDGGITIGDNCLISWNVLITDSDTHLTNSSRVSDARDWNIGLRTGRRGEYKEWDGIRSAPVRIGNNVWIGYGAVILPGVCIGDNAIIGAASVVTRNVKPGSTVAGNPANVIKVE